MKSRKPLKEVLCPDGALIRESWLNFLWRIVAPVLENGANGTLKARMPIRGPRPDERAQFSHLEACGRTLAGIAPWLEVGGLTGEEAELQGRARSLAQATITSITDPASPDFLNFNTGAQPVVDASYLAQAILRAPRTLWDELPQQARRNVLSALASSRRIRPYFNNWLLFPAMIEALFCRVKMPFDAMRVDYALRQVEQWYVGDGMYADGPKYHCDYYNSFVIHPFLLDILGATEQTKGWPGFGARALRRAQRYCVLLERMISPEGTLPATGRSLSYRCGTLHAMAQLVLINQVPAALEPAQLRSAMTAVIRRSLSPAGTFDDEGWLNIGYCGSQPGLAEKYISTGSLYLASLAFLPLGLPADAPFWCDPERPFTSQALCAGADIPADSALDDD